MRAYHGLRATGMFNEYFVKPTGEPFTRERDDAELIILKLLPNLYKIRNIGRVLKETVVQKLNEALIKYEPIKK